MCMHIYIYYIIYVYIYIYILYDILYVYNIPGWCLSHLPEKKRLFNRYDPRIGFRLRCRGTYQLTRPVGTSSVVWKTSCVSCIVVSPMSVSIQWWFPSSGSHFMLMSIKISFVLEPECQNDAGLLVPQDHLKAVAFDPCPVYPRRFVVFFFLILKCCSCLGSREQLPTLSSHLQLSFDFVKQKTCVTSLPSNARYAQKSPAEGDKLLLQ